MYIDYSTWETFEYTLNSLSLDLNNPRIKYRGVPLNQTQIMKFLIENEKVYELAKKISEEGYFVGEEPIICIENNKNIVQFLVLSLALDYGCAHMVDFQ